MTYLQIITTVLALVTKWGPEFVQALTEFIAAFKVQKMAQTGVAAALECDEPCLPPDVQAAAENLAGCCERSLPA